MGKATDDLRKEHAAILHALKTMDSLVTSPAMEEPAKLRYGKEYVYFLQTFADMCHHGKEENYFFEALLETGSPEEKELIADLLQEHALARQHLRAMKASLETGDISGFTVAGASYRNLLEHHIEKENSHLFLRADQLLDPPKQAELYEQFEAYEESVVGHGVHQELHGMINAWTREWETLSGESAD